MGAYSGPEIVNNGLVLHLDAANERSYPGSGTSWTDISGNSNIANTGTTNYSSNYNGAFTFSGDQNITCSGVPTGNTWSILIWTANIGPTAFATVGHRTFASTDSMRFQWDENLDTPTARGPFYNVGGTYAIHDNAFTPEFWFNRWHLVSAVGNGTTVNCYLNDNITCETPQNLSTNFSTNGNIMLGYNGLSGNGGVDAINRDGGTVYISQTLIYNRALSAAELIQNYHATKSRYNI